MNKKKEENILIKMVKSTSVYPKFWVVTVVIILIGFVFGRTLDDFFSTTPWLTVILTMIAVILVIRSLYDFAKKN